MTTFIRYFAERNTVANVITLLLVALGVGALSVIQRDNFPSVDFNEMIVTTRYPGASPEDVELNVTNEIETELKEVDGLDQVVSFSMENISIIHIKLDHDLKNPDKTKTDVRDAVSKVSDLPAEVDGLPSVEEITTSTGIPIIEVGLSGDIPYETLRNIARQAEKQLLNVPGVSRLEKFGYFDREIKIELSREALERIQIPADEIVSAIRNRNIRSTGGSFESYTSEKNIVTLAQFEAPQQVNDVIIRSRPGEAIIRVRDVAQIKDGFESAKVLSNMNGKRSISFLIYKKESADIIRTVDAVKDFVESNSVRLPAGVSIEYSNDTSRIVRNRLQVVTYNGVIGLLLVLGVLAMFLNFRSAFWVAMGIPVTLLGTLFLLPVFGAYLDSIALAAMILVIGIIVDDGIVVAENIWACRERGMKPVDAAVEGLSSVFKPVLTTIITTALAFAPMFFMPGIMGSFVFVIPLVVILALVISLAEITMALPAHLTSGSGNQTITRHEDHFFNRIRKVFCTFLIRMMKLRYLVVLVFSGFLLAAFWYASRYMDFVLFPTQSADTFYVTVELPSGSSLQHTAIRISDLEKIIAELPVNELDSYVTRIGSHGDFNLGENENWALLGVYLTPFSTRNRDADEIVESVRHSMEQVEGITNLNFIIDGGGPPVGRPITIRVAGSDDRLRNLLAQRVTELLQETEGVKDIDRNDKPGKQQISVDLDHLRLAEMGLNVSDVAKNIRLAYDGEIVTSVRYGDEDVKYRVQFEHSDRSSETTLARLIVPNREGRFIRLNEVAEFSQEPGPSNIYHFDNDRAITITADVIKGVTTPLNATTLVRSQIDMDKDWPGLQLLVGGEAEETQDSMASLGITFISAGLGIYLVLLLLFNSMVQPVVVMLAIPFGLVGVITAFGLHGESLGFLAMLGVVGLTGIVVNDSLILVNLANRLRDENSQTPFIELVISAASDRLRPILLTSITTVAGLLPMAYGVGGSDPFAAPMALAMGYGILFATPLTLILLPCMLIVQEDITAGFRKLIPRKKQKAGS